ncbi:MAG: hypothetical protein FJ308_19315, partial [Planctomycetes bacterium]|nr:hypothetical protein [Planctomycetota bacterium]
MKLTQITRNWLLSVLLASSCIASPAVAQDTSLKTFSENFQKLVAEKDFDGALKLVDEPNDLKPESLASFRIQLGSQLLREKRGSDASAQFTKALEATFAKLEDGSNPRAFATNLPLAVMMLRQSNPDQADQWIEKGLTTLRGKLDSEKLSDNHGILAQMMRLKLNTPD